MEKDERYLRAKRKMENLKRFYSHLTVYILVNIMIFIVNLITDPGDWWFIYPLLGWGIAIVIQAFTTFVPDKFGTDWEEKKIKEYMEKDKRN